MSSYTQPNIKTYKAEGAIVKNSFAKFGTSDDLVLASAAAERAIGVNMSDDVVANDAVEIALQGGGALVKLAATIARGSSIASDANGLGVLATTGQFAPCIAMESGVSGDVISVIMNIHQAI